jgi:5-(carboxyamino)imidazole ribonucleotide mutase
MANRFELTPLKWENLSCIFSIQSENRSLLIQAKLKNRNQGDLTMKKVGIIMGSDSDLPVVKKATGVLDELGIPYEAHVYSAHRTPAEARAWSLNARKDGFGVIIAFAGMAAHLAGAIAANTTLPVIGVPCKSAAFDGMDALLSTVMMPSGIPVATVAVDGGKNAALLAAEILAVADEELADTLDARRSAEAEAVLTKDEGIMERLK